MANNIEWSHATALPNPVDPEDIPGSYEGLGKGEIGVWLGHDGANILYGTPEQMLEWGRAFIKTVTGAGVHRGGSVESTTIGGPS